MWRLGPDGYEPAAPEANGRLRSVELGLEFDLDADGLLQIYTLAGERLLTHEETDQRLQQVELRAQEAEARLADEAARRAGAATGGVAGAAGRGGAAGRRIRTERLIQPHLAPQP